MSVCVKCGATKLTEHPCPKCAGPLVDVPARLREKAARLRTAKPKMVNGRVRMQVKITDAIEADLLDLLAASYERIDGLDDLRDKSCCRGADDPCDECEAVYTIKSRIEEAAR